MSNNIHKRCAEIMAELGKNGEFEFWEEFQWLPKQKLEKRLKDILEDDIDEKYYLSDKMTKNIDMTPISSCLSGTDHKQPNCTPIGLLDIKGNDSIPRVYDTKGLSPCLTTMEGGNRQPKIRVEHKVSLNIKKSVRDNFIRDYESIAKTNKKIWYSDCKSGWLDNRVCIKESACLRANNNNLFTLDNDFRIRKLTPRECFRLQDFDDTFLDNLIYTKSTSYQLVYDIINKKGIKWNVKLKTVKENQKLLSMETYALCTIKEKTELEQLMKIQSPRSLEQKENQKNVNIVIVKLVESEQKECATNTIKWKDCITTLFTEIKQKDCQEVVVILDTTMEKDCTEQLWKIKLEDCLNQQKLYTTLIVLKQIIESKIYTYVKTKANIKSCIKSLTEYKSNLWKIELLYLKMESIEQKVSNSMLYKQAGNSISVNISEMIFRQIELSKNGNINKDSLF